MQTDNVPCRLSIYIRSRHRKVEQGPIKSVTACHRPSINKNEMNKKKSEVKENKFTHALNPDCVGIFFLYFLK